MECILLGACTALGLLYSLYLYSRKKKIAARIISADRESCFYLIMGSSDTIVVLSELTIKQIWFKYHLSQTRMFVSLTTLCFG